MELPPKHTWFLKPCITYIIPHQEPMNTWIEIKMNKELTRKVSNVDLSFFLIPMQGRNLIFLSKCVSRYCPLIEERKFYSWLIIWEKCKVQLQVPHRQSHIKSPIKGPCIVHIQAHACVYKCRAYYPQYKENLVENILLHIIT